MGGLLTAVVLQALGSLVLAGPELDRTPAPAPNDAPQANGDAPCERRESEIARLRREVLELRHQLAAATPADERASAGDVASTALSWPASAPEMLAPGSFLEELSRFVEHADGPDVVAVDCSEYPCIGILSSPGEGGHEASSEALRNMGFSAFDGAPFRAVVIAAERSGDDPEAGVVAAALLGPEDEALQGRVHARAHQLLSDFSTVR